MEVPLKVEDDTLYCVTTGPSPVVLDLVRRVEQLEQEWKQKEAMLQTIHLCMIANGMVGTWNRSSSVDLEGEEEMDVKGGSVSGLELELEADDEHVDEDSHSESELDSGRGSPPPPRLEKEVSFFPADEIHVAANECRDAAIDSDVEIPEEDQHDELDFGARTSPTSSLTSDSENEGRREDEISQSKRTMTDTKMHQCVSCDAEFYSLMDLHAHCVSFGEQRHGKRCPSVAKYFNSKSFWKRHIDKCPHHQDDVSFHLDDSGSDSDDEAQTAAIGFGSRRSSRSRRKNIKSGELVEGNQGNDHSKKKKPRYNSDKNVGSTARISASGKISKNKAHQRSSSTNTLQASSSERYQCVTCDKQFNGRAELFLHCSRERIKGIRHGKQCPKSKSNFYNSKSSWKIHLKNCSDCRKKHDDGEGSEQTRKPRRGRPRHVPEQDRGRKVQNSESDSGETLEANSSSHNIGEASDRPEMNMSLHQLFQCLANKFKDQ